MLLLVNTYRAPVVDKLKKWCCISLVLLLFVNTLSPILTLTALRLHFETCQQHTLQGQPCKFSQMLAELAPDNGISSHKHVVPFADANLNFFISTKGMEQPPTGDPMSANFVSIHSIHYSQPVLENNSPPPRFI